DLTLGAGNVVAARRDDHDLRLRRDDLLPFDGDRRLTSFAKNILATGQFDHLGNPVSGGVNRIEPFDDGDTWALLRFELARAAGDFADALLQCVNDLTGFVNGAGRFANAADIGQNSGQILRIEREQLRLGAQFARRLDDCVPRDRADVAKTLRDDQIR